MRQWMDDKAGIQMKQVCRWPLKHTGKESRKPPALSVSKLVQEALLEATVK